MRAEVQARVDNPSYVANEKIVLTLDWSRPSIALSDIGNMSTDFFRIGISRNDFAFGAGTRPKVIGDKLILEFIIPSSLPEGVYSASRTIVTEIGDKEVCDPIHLTFQPVFFDVRNHYQNAATEANVFARLANLEKQREEFINRVHKSEAATKDPETGKFFLVIVFAVGCLIHSRQQLEGFRIDPLRIGLSHKRFLEVVNDFLANEGCDHLPYLEQTEAAFQNSTPTLAVTFPRVQATDHEDALEYCRAHCTDLFLLLGFEKGQVPREFAYLAMEHGTTKRWHLFEMPSFRGNLISDFNPVQLANSIERQLPELKANPFKRLLVRSFSEATAERDFGFRVLRLWTVLELAADRAIPKNMHLRHPDGAPILKPNGNPETTNSKHGRVYEYIRRSGAFSSMSQHRDENREISVIMGDKSDPRIKLGTIVVTLWEMILAVYAVRCAVAHEGYFDSSKRSTQGEILASDFLIRGYPDLISFTTMQAKLAIWREK